MFLPACTDRATCRQRGWPGRSWSSYLGWIEVRLSLFKYEPFVYNSGHTTHSIFHSKVYPHILITIILLLNSYYTGRYISRFRILVPERSLPYFLKLCRNFQLESRLSWPVTINKPSSFQQHS